MKHTFVFIDKIIVLLRCVTHPINSEKDKTKAKNAIILLEEYTQILIRLIDGHKTKEHLEALNNSHIDEIEDWAKKVEALFKKMRILLIILDEDTKKLADVLENNPEEWVEALSDMNMSLVMTGLHNEEENMIRFRKISIFETHKLKEIIDHKKHEEGLHFWQNFEERSEETRFIVHGLYFENLLS